MNHKFTSPLYGHIKPRNDSECIRSRKPSAFRVANAIRQSCPFKGSVCIRKYDRDFNLIEESQHTNLINKRAVELLFSNQPVFTDDRRVALSTDSYTPDFERIVVDNVIAIGDDTAAGATGYVFAEATELAGRAVTYGNRFAPPAAARTINTIALVDGSANNNLSNITANAYAYLNLATAIEQGTTETLDVLYQVSIDWISNPVLLNESFQSELEYLFLGQITTGLEYDNNNILHQVYSANNSDRDLRFHSVEGEDISVSYTEHLDYLIRRYSGTYNLPIDRLNYGVAFGKLVRGDHAGNRGFKATAGVIEIERGATLGTVFSHNETATALFYDVNALANSTWKPDFFDVANNTNSLPTIYALKVESSGGEGVGTYALYKTPYSGGKTNDTTWNQRPRPLVVTQKYPYFVEGDDDIPYNNKWIYHWVDDTLWVSANDTTVAIWQIFPEFLILQSWTLPVSKINDLATDIDSQKIYVATEQGLYEIDAVANSFSQLSPDKAMAVDVGYNAAVFSILINNGLGRLASSLNASWDTAHSFSGTITWANVLFIRCDRTSANHNLAILEFRYNPNSSAVYANLYSETEKWVAKIHWWNNVSNYDSELQLEHTINSTSVYYHKSICFPYNSSFVCKDGLWVYPRYFRYYVSRSVSDFRSISREKAKALEAEAGITLDPIFWSSLYEASETVTGVSQYATEIREASSGATNQYLEYCYPSYVILDKDTSDGWLSIVRGGYEDSGSINTNYSDSNYLKFSAGAIDLKVDAADPSSNEIRRFQDVEIGEYTFHPNYAAEKESLYNLGGNPVGLKDGGVLCFHDSAVTRDDYQFARGFAKDSYTYYQPIMISVWGAGNKEGVFNYPGFAARYGWNSATSQWEQDPDNLLPGKPLHTSQDALIDGLEISWSDLNPTDTRDLIANQFYTCVRVPGDKGVISDGTYLNAEPIEFAYYLRPTATYNLNVTISGTQLTLDPATTDPLWLSLDPFDGKVINLTIASVEATIILTGTPAGGEILVADAHAGILEFNSADVGKTVSGEVLYLQKIHETEVL